jgi:hypothetical protein
MGDDLSASAINPGRVNNAVRALDDCRVYWGGHGCNELRGHEGPHRCGHDGRPDVLMWSRDADEDGHWGVDEGGHEAYLYGDDVGLYSVGDGSQPR